MRALVTGGSGFIGTNLISSLLSAGNQVLNFDRCEPRNVDHAEFWMEGDLRVERDVEAALRVAKPDVVFHLGARTDLHGSTLGEYDANIAGVRVVVDSINRISPAVRVIYASSRLVCKIGWQPTSDEDYCPPNLYGESKVVGEQLVRTHARHPWVIVRPTSIWGPWFGVPYRDFFDTVLGGKFPVIRGPEIYKSFGFVGNTVHELMSIERAHRDLSGGTFYLADYPPVEVNRFAAQIRELAGIPTPPQIPVAPLRLVARAGDLLKRLGMKEPKLTSFRLNNLLTPMIHDLKAVEAVSGPLPYGTRDGVRATLDWMATHG